MEPFHYFNFETDFLENESLFEKLEYCFLVESTNTENASFTYKTAISEADVKAKQNSEYKMDLSQRTEFCQYLLYFFEDFVSV